MNNVQLFAHQHRDNVKNTLSQCKWCNDRQIKIIDDYRVLITRSNFQCKAVIFLNEIMTSSQSITTQFTSDKTLNRDN